MLALGLYLPLTLLAPIAYADQTVSKVVVPSSATASIAWPAFGASAFGVLGEPGVAGSSGSTTPLPIASISKIVTALVTLEAKPLKAGESGPTITFSAADHALYSKYVKLQGTVAPMATGSSMTEHEVMQVALIASANNYAEALADWAFGSEPAFVAATKTWLASHHLDATTLVEPTGINPANVSTATDLVKLGTLALANPIVSAIVDTPTLTLPGVGTVKDTNRLLGKEGVFGIKTGTLVPAGSNLLFAAHYTVAGKRLTIVGAVVGAKDRDTLYPAVTALLTAIKGGFHAVTLAKKGQSFATYSTAWNGAADAVAGADVKAVVWSNSKISSIVTPAPIRFGAKGAKAGVATFTVGTTNIAVPLVLSRGIVDPGPWWRLANPLATLGIGR